MATLDLKNIVSVTVNLSPQPVIRAAFNLGLIVGRSPVIPVTTRVKYYSSLDEMLTDGWGGFEAEYNAASLYFSQNPRPAKVLIGRQNNGETLLQAITACRAANTEWYVVYGCIESKSDAIAVAQYIESCTPASLHFFSTSDAEVLAGTAGNIFDTLKGLGYKRSIGQYSTNSFSTRGCEIGAAGGSTDISVGSATTFKVAVDGGVATSVTLTLTGMNTGAKIANEMQTKIRALGGAFVNVVVQYVGGVYTIYSGTSGTLSNVAVTAGTSNDVAATLKIGAANGAQAIAGAVLPMSAVAIMGYAMGANTRTAGSAYTLAYKQEVGVSTENLTEAQATSIKGFNGNIYVNRGSSYNVFEQGVVSNGLPFDEILGLDALSNAMQQEVTNLLTSVNKVPQSEDGMSMLKTAINTPLREAVSTGFIAPGIWTGPDVLKLDTGDALSQGFLIQSDPIATQSTIDRANRIAPPIYVCIKLAGAIEHVVMTVNVNV